MVVTTTDAGRRLPRARAGPRPPPPSSGRSTCSPPRSAWTRPRCAGATCCPRSTSRSPRRPARPTTAATTRRRSSGRWRPPATTTCGPSRRRRRAAGRPRVALGIGVSCYVEVTAGPSAGSEFGRVEIRPADADGGATASRSSSHRHARPTGRASPPRSPCWSPTRLGVPIERGRGGARRHRRGGPGASARSARGRCSSGGSAVRERRRRGGRPRPGRWRPSCWRPPVDDVVLDAGRGAFHVVGTPAVGRAPGPTVAAAAVGDGGTGWPPSTTSPATQPTYPFGAHVAVVEVDTETGEVRLRAAGGVRRRRPGPQPAARRGPAPRRPGPGRGPGAVRAGGASTPTATR